MGEQETSLSSGRFAVAHDRDGNIIECQTPAFYTSICLLCEQKVVIHCRQCSMQISGCLCTLSKKMEAQRELSQAGPEATCEECGGPWHFSGTCQTCGNRTWIPREEGR